MIGSSSGQSSHVYIPLTHILSIENWVGCLDNMCIISIQWSNYDETQSIPKCKKWGSYLFMYILRWSQLGSLFIFVFQMNSHMCFDLNQVWNYIIYYILYNQQFN